MTRAHLSPWEITDDADERVTDATVRVYKPGTTTPIPDTIYTSRSGVGTRSNSGWAETDGVVDFYLNTPQVVSLGITRSGHSEVIIDDLDVGTPYGDDNVKTYGCRGDGTLADEYDELTEALETMEEGDYRWFPRGTYYTGTELKIPPLNGAVLDAPAGSQVDLPPAVIRAKAGSNLKAIMASRTWLTNGDEDDPSGLSITGLGFDGGGFREGNSHMLSNEVETTADTENGLVVRGIGYKLRDVFILSSNGHGLIDAGCVTEDGTVLDETYQSHENSILDCAIRYSGLDNFHINPGAQDSRVRNLKAQGAGQYCVFSDDQCPAWWFSEMRPGFAGLDLMHLKSGWNVRVTDGEFVTIGQYLDGASITHYGLYIEGGGKLTIISGNSFTDDASGDQDDPITAIRLHSFAGVCRSNTFMYNTNDTGVAIEKTGTTNANVTAGIALIEDPVTLASGTGV